MRRSAATPLLPWLLLALGIPPTATPLRRATHAANTLAWSWAAN